ncbi:MAG: ATP-binding protein [Steroidobacteraceae bacterium]|jgi:two-component system sensor histidine kinase PilS (NtrC family)|nr:ATP-binding protein [Steroidobacteraceae bacterium]
MNTLASPLAITPELSWRVLRLLNLFRILVPTVLLTVFAFGQEPRVVGNANPELFGAVCLAYFTLALVFVALLKRRWPGFLWQAYGPVLVDLVALTLIVYASGGAESGLGILMLVPVGAVSLLGTHRPALLIAAAASLGLLSQQVALWLAEVTGIAGFAQAGYYGGILFAVAGTGAFLAGRLRETEAVVRQRDIDLANLAELSEYIVQHLRESIVVVDSEDRIRLINESARQILGPAARPGQLLGEVAPRLLYHVESWRRRPEGTATESAKLVSADGACEVEAYFAPLGGQRPAPVIVFLEDTSRLAERVQQSKLAALGRLSASIAHEIRNPVGAMSHAAQLLAESPSLSPQEQRMTQIITANAERVSSIITNVLQLSRRESTKPERLYAHAWLEDFLQEFRATLQVSEARLVALAPADDVEVRVDPSHLHQIVWNLCENALRHSAEVAGEPPVEVRLGRLQVNARPFLEVADRGSGIAPEAADRIFEPFFTNRQGGTGLGLFIARELAQTNGAVLLYEPRAGGGSIFRVIFNDPQRWEPA